MICKDCECDGACDDWETLEDVPLCIDCFEERVANRKHNPPEWEMS